MRKALVLGTLAFAVAGVGLAAPASATDATFSLSGTTLGLAVSVPASTVNLGSASTGAASLSGSLGAVTVTDARGLLAPTWTATVTTTAFTTGTATANETVATSAIRYSSGAGTAATGQLGAMVQSSSAVVGSGVTAATWAGVGNNTVTWTPTLTFTLLASQIAGTYSGTITHSVA